MINFSFFNINKKKYLAKNKNYLIIDFLNLKIGSLILFKKINIFFLKKIKIYNKNFNLKIFAILLKHFYIKNISIVKKRRKNVIKKNIHYRKKSLLYIYKIN
ncbi:putative ribosomal protein L21 [Candidatus Carsonella ruddii CS isolate Thao2000]|uniref:Putative ribosomal protein L21 n=1 Tax=Candidatus Carsonella ruddii CS isolate Thao2000 TaxID=1202537 RepID=J7GWH8_CARRU|nr:bL21 family ribosomal protein [Candidatus Carsonella ruddii]AFP83806.1 putative ribosomal protein L21 [Candidatus Carsonella ruddii CS isolate Thao2000]